MEVDEEQEERVPKQGEAEFPYMESRKNIIICYKDKLTI